MSRHRNLKNLIADDDYYDDYDDYDDDGDYNDGDDYGYDDYGNKSKSKITTKASSNSTAKNQPVAVAVKAVAAKTKNTPGIQAKGKHQHQQPSKQQQPAKTAGVVKPPPGWGKPSPSSTAAASAPTATKACATPTRTPGIAKPPPGWGKPTPAGAAASSFTAAATPPTALSPTTSTNTNTSKTAPTTTTMNSKSTSQHQQSTTTTTPATTTTTSKQTAGRSIPPILQQEAASSKQAQLSMVVCGHVDAGKSTILGQLLYQMGHVTKRQAMKVSQSNPNNADNNNSNSNNTNNIQWAWLLDEDDGERARGVTMQIATKAIATPHFPHIVLLDAPGHADFIPTMITGAANADAALLVVDASEAIDAAFDGGGQTKEHLLIARGVGVTQLIVCVNKLDAVQPPWSQTVYHNIQQALLPFLTQQAKFVPKRIRFVPTSGLTGINIMMANNNNNNSSSSATTSSTSSVIIPDELKQWYQGPTLIEAIDSFQPVKQSNLDLPLRIILTDVYAEGKGVGARGRIVQGFVEAGERIVVLPIGDDATIAGLQHLHHTLPDNVPAERFHFAVAGETVDMTLTGIDSMRVSTGSILSRTALPLRPLVRNKCRATIVVMDELSIPIIRGAQVLFHIHSLDIPAVLTQLISATKRGAGGSGSNGNSSETKSRPRAITSSSTAVVEITLSNPICMEAFQQCKALGRFVLRRSGQTIAVGVIDQVL